MKTKKSKDEEATEKQVMRELGKMMAIDKPSELYVKKGEKLNFYLVFTPENSKRNRSILIIDDRKEPAKVLIPIFDHIPEDSQGEPGDMIAYRKKPDAEEAQVFIRLQEEHKIEAPPLKNEWYRENWISYVLTKQEDIYERQGIIPFDREKFEQYQDIFGHWPRIPGLPQRTTDGEGREISTYTKDIAGGTLTWQFYEDLIKQETLPTLGHRSKRLWYSMIYVAKKQHTGLDGSFTASEIARRWGIDVSGGGDFYPDLRWSFYSLAAMNFIFTNHRKGTARREWGFAFILDFDIRGEGRETRYKYTLNPKAIGITEQWLLDQLTPDELQKLKESKQFYVPYPVEYLGEPLPNAEDNLRDKLLLIEPKKAGYTVKAWTFLKDWCKLRDDLLKRPSYCDGILYELLETAKKKGWLLDYSVKPKGQNIKSWQVTIWRSTKKAKGKEQPQDKPEPTTERPETGTETQEPGGEDLLWKKQGDEARKAIEELDHKRNETKQPPSESSESR